MPPISSLDDKISNLKLVEKGYYLLVLTSLIPVRSSHFIGKEEEVSDTK